MPRTPKEKLTIELEPGEFVKLRDEIYLILDNVPRKDRTEVFVTRADIDDGKVLIMSLPFAWIATVEHQELPHHRAMLPG